MVQIVGFAFSAVTLRGSIISFGDVEINTNEIATSIPTAAITP